jgi:hypothetical protein
VGAGEVISCLFTFPKTPVFNLVLLRFGHHFNVKDR